MRSMPQVEARNENSQSHQVRRFRGRSAKGCEHGPMTDDLAQDPGWRLSAGSILKFLIPGYLKMAARRSPQDGLAMLRDVWTAFFGAVVMFGVVLLFIPQVPTGTAAAPTVILAVLALALLAGASVVGRRPLECATPEALANSYRTRFFLRTALSEMIALAAFAAAFVAGRNWLYYVFAPLTLAGFLANAPTGSHLAAEQEALQWNGCAHSLVAALRRVPMGKN